MRWNKTTISRKMTVGFGSILVLMALFSLFSLNGLEGIIGDASEAIEGNKLARLLSDMELDILTWANNVDRLLTDESVSSLEIQTDERKSSFGLWLYGEGRKEAEALLPSLAPLLKEIEEPYQRLYQSVAMIQEHFQGADDNLPNSLTAREVNLLAWSDKVNELFLKNLPGLEVEADEGRFVLGEWLQSDEALRSMAENKELGELLKLLRESHKKLHQSALKIQKTYRQIHPGLSDILRDLLEGHRKSVQKVALAIIQGQSDFDVETDPLQSPMGKFLASDKAVKYMEGFEIFKGTVEAVQEPNRRFYESLIPIQKALADGNVGAVEHMFQILTLPAIEEIAGQCLAAIEAENQLVQAQQSALEIYRSETVSVLKEMTDILVKMNEQAHHLLQGKKEAREIFALRTLGSLQKTQELLDKIRKEVREGILTDEVMLETAKDTKIYMIITGIATILAGIVLTFFIGRSIIRVLRGVSTQIEEASDQVASASTHFASVSQQLARGASQQAASTEQISASLEEMAAMTRQNADNALQASTLVIDASQIVGHANSFMSDLTLSMKEISAASEETSKIIKTIDEIAFQTNLLALNAAVEAARAGEAGAGFAVVADEVRSLSMRAAKAAKNTTHMIEGTTKKVKEGKELVHRTASTFSETVTKTEKAAELVREIAAASQEQAEGIDQVTKAVAEMDKVVQSNAATAEESASASQQMDTQATRIREVFDLLAILTGGKGKDHSTGRKPVLPNDELRRSETPLPLAPVSDTGKQGKKVSNAKEVTPEQIIPFDEENFSDF